MSVKVNSPNHFKKNGTTISPVTPGDDLDMLTGKITTTGVATIGDASLLASNAAPTTDPMIANKKYVDDNSGGAPEGTAVLSTGEAGATKFLREDGDGTCSWQTAAGSGDVSATANMTDNTIIKGDGGAKGVQDSGITISDSDEMAGVIINDFTNDIHADHLHEQLRNEEGSTMNIGDAVYVSGYHVGSSTSLCKLADATDATEMPCIAIVAEASIANNASGHFIEAGTITGMDTSSWSAGDELFVSESGTTGNTLTSTKPVGTALIQEVAVVLRSHATLGIIEVLGAGEVSNLPNIANTKVWIGDINGVPQEFALSGDVTMTAGGAVTIVDNSHTIVSHDTTATGANLTQLTDGSDTTLHDHDGISENTSSRHNESHTVASHSDTTATGAELNTLTGGGDTTLHDHDGISENTTHRSSDGTDHANVVTNDTHVAGDGSDHSNVAANTIKTAMLTREATTTGGKIEMLEGTNNGTSKVIFSSPASLGADRTITIPDANVDLGDIATNSTHTAGDGSDHADVATNTAASHAQSHTVASHSDTTGTGAELNELTDGSTTTLHNHTPPEGTAVLSTGEGGGTKFLREDGDGTSSWQTPSGGGDVTASINLTDATIVQGDGGAKGVKTSTATVGQIATNVTHVAGDGSDHADVATNTTHRGLTNNPHNTEMIDDTTPELGGEMDAGAHTIGFTEQSATGDGTTTIDWKLGNKFFFTFGAQNDTFTFTAPTNPCNILLVLKQDGTGSRTATWPASVKWPSGTAPTLTTGGNSIDIVSFYYDGTSFYGVGSLNFS